MIREVVLWQVVFVHVPFSFWGCFFLGDSFRMRLPLNGEVAEWFKAHLKACVLTGIEGSNPSLSAMSLNLIPLPFLLPCLRSLWPQSEPLFRVSEKGKEGGNTFQDQPWMSFRVAFGTDFDSNSESMLQK